MNTISLKNSINNSKWYNAMLVIQIILFLGAVVMTSEIGVEHLRHYEVMNVSLDLLAMLVSIIIFISCILGKKNESTFSFMLLLFVTFLCVFCEHGLRIADGVAKLRIFNYIYNIGANSIICLLSGLFYLFAYESLHVKLKKDKMILISIMIVIVMGVLAELLNVFSGFYYTIDQNGYYVRNSTGSWFGYLPILYCNGLTIWIVIHQKITKKEKGIYLSYLLVPLVTSVWYMITDCPPTFYFACFISMLLIYANIYIEIGHDALRYELANAYNEVELALQKNKLTLSQIKPHFIFNALGSIEELCYADSSKAVEAVHYFSKYLRANIDGLGETEVTSFQNELDHIRNYIWLEKMRFDEDLDYREELSVENFYLPTLCVQPLVENAVKHGMMGTEEGTLHVVLKTTETDQYYKIQVIDDGCGFDMNQKKDDGRSHVGLSYAKTCLEKRFHGFMEVESEIGKGTSITMYLPKDIE